LLCTSPEILNKVYIHTIISLFFTGSCLLSNKKADGIAVAFIKSVCLCIFLCLLTTASPYPLQAQAVMELSARPADSVSVRSFKQENLEKYLSDEEYRYDREFRPQAPSLWQRFKQWLFDKFIQALGNENTSDLLRWSIYIFCGIVILYVILKLTNTSIRGLIYGEAQRGRTAFTESEENIHQLDFAALLKEAVAGGQYNRAVRLHYLQTLKNLSDKNLIDWRINKTNHDYLQELAKTELAPAFRSLTILFEYICYGDFQMNGADFAEASARFNTFDEQVQKRTASTYTSKVVNN
jgi:hypothetical protein